MNRIQMIALCKKWDIADGMPTRTTVFPPSLRGSLAKRFVYWIQRGMLILGMGFIAATSRGQLVVTTFAPKVENRKAVVAMTMKNAFPEKVESARAVVFLLDEQGKMVGQTTRWVIGGSNTNSLPAGATNMFHFVINAEKPITTTNLVVKITFNRVVLESGKLADIAKDVQIRTVPR